MRQLLPEIRELELDQVYDGLTLDQGEAHARGGHPWIALGMVASIDGAAAIGGTSGELGGDADRIAFSRLRGACDAILVGAGTVRAESYRPPRSPDARRADRVARGLSPDPQLIIVSGTLGIDPGHRVFADPERRPIVVTRGGHDAERVSAIGEVAEMIEVGQRAVDLSGALAQLGQRGLRRILCEGGPALAASLHAEDLLDEVFVTLAPGLVGGEGPRIVLGNEEHVRRMDLVSLHEHDGELLLRYRRPIRRGP